jgi:hypothetical protein
LAFFTLWDGFAILVSLRLVLTDGALIGVKNIRQISVESMAKAP